MGVVILLAPHELRDGRLVSLLLCPGVAACCDNLYSCLLAPRQPCAHGCRGAQSAPVAQGAQLMLPDGAGIFSPPSFEASQDLPVS